MSFVLEEPTLSTTEASRMLGYTTPDYLLRLIRNGVVRAERVGGRWQIERREIELRLARVEKKRSSASFREQDSAARRSEIRERFTPLVGRES
jgi:excisionase family DNA binding protein